MTELLQSTGQTEEKVKELRIFLAGIIPEQSSEHYALRDFIEREVRQLAFDQGGKPGPKYDLCVERIGRRMGVPAYASTYNRIEGFKEELVDLDENKDPILANKSALKKIVETSVDLKLSDPLVLKAIEQG